MLVGFGPDPYCRSLPVIDSAPFKLTPSAGRLNPPTLTLLGSALAMMAEPPAQHRHSKRHATYPRKCRRGAVPTRMPLGKSRAAPSAVSKHPVTSG